LCTNKQTPKCHVGSSLTNSIGSSCSSWAKLVGGHEKRTNMVARPQVMVALFIYLFVTCTASLYEQYTPCGHYTASFQSKPKN
jgi:hypothetical protein